PPVPEPPSVPGNRSAGAADNAALDPPVKTKPGEAPPAPKNEINPPANPTGAGSSWAPATGKPPPALDRMASPSGSNTGIEGWDRRPPSPVINVPPQGGPAIPSTPLPPAPQWNSLPPSAPPGAPTPPAETPAFPGVHLPSVSTPVPSCVVVGRKVE